MNDTGFKVFEETFLEKALSVIAQLCEHIAGRGLEGFGVPLKVSNAKSCGLVVTQGDFSVSLYIQDGDDVGVSGPTMALCCGVGEEGQSTWSVCDELMQPMVDPEEIEHRLASFNVVDAAKWIVTEWCNNKLCARPARQQRC
jgi:hypothetical protein